MTEQPLHNCAESLVTVEFRLEGIVTLINEGKIISAYKEMIEVQRMIGSVRFTIREKALREEGDQIV